MRVTIFMTAFCGWALARPDSRSKELDDSQMHPSLSKSNAKVRSEINSRELSSSYWNNVAQNIIKEKLNTEVNENVAKNVILFLGDGMSIPTLAAARVYYGGEEKELSFEQLPYTALSKTYCVDKQTADSACTATAYLGGVKNNYGTIGVTAAVERTNCATMLEEENRVYSIARWSQDEGKRTGIVTTSTVTDASPAGAYAHTAERNWQSDTNIISAGLNATECRDIAYQLIKEKTGSQFNVILGGGSRVFLPSGTYDDLGAEGTRSDDVNLITEWLNDKAAIGSKANYVWNRADMLNVDDDVDYILGLFSEGYMPYNTDRNTTLTPSLEEMTKTAIKIVSKGNGAENGYFLFIEGGRIDHGHHASWAKRALEETLEFSKAIQAALDLTNQEDTLIVVTSDHAHTMSMSGYPSRYNNIFGAAGSDSNNSIRLTLNYANGPGYVGEEHDFGTDDTSDKEFRFPSVSPLSSETHGADDVGIFARGPWAHLYSGVIEQNAIPHIMAYASCVGDGITVCSGALRTVIKLNFPLVLGTFILFYFL